MPTKSESVRSPTRTSVAPTLPRPKAYAALSEPWWRGRRRSGRPAAYTLSKPLGLSTISPSWNVYCARSCSGGTGRASSEASTPSDFVRARFTYVPSYVL